MIQILKNLYLCSPQTNVQSLKSTLFKQKFGASPSTETKNVLIPEDWESPTYSSWIANRLKKVNRQIFLLGDKQKVSRLHNSLQIHEIQTIVIEWDWGTELRKGQIKEGQVTICRVPENDSHWRLLREFRKQYANLTVIHELLLPSTLITVAQQRLRYFPYAQTIEEVIPFYFGQDFWGPIRELNQIYPLQNKRIIELGPGDATQTAGLLASGASHVTCIEIRAENALKILTAIRSLQWNNVQLILDDFHNVNRINYGEYDLVFAHGVHYHSIAPFVLFENLLSLAENIVLGGFFGTDSVAGKWKYIEYEGQKFRFKPYDDVPTGFGSGVNRAGYLFEREEIITFFQKIGCDVTILADIPQWSKQDPRRFATLLLQQRHKKNSEEGGKPPTVKEPGTIRQIHAAQSYPARRTKT